MAQIHILHENEEWLAPLRAALDARGLAYTDWHLAKGGFDLSAPPPEGIFYNRMSASSHTRGHDFAPEFTAAVLAWLKAHGRRVINGPNALDLEISKVRQYAALAEHGVKIPETRFALGKEEILQAATAMGTPVVVKPNRGGKGLGVQLFNDLTTLEVYLESPMFDAGRDGIVLVQQYVKAPDETIVRSEFVAGKFVYAVRVDTSDGFELCPAEACRIEDKFCPVGEEAEQKPMFEIVDGFDHPNLAKFEAFMAANDIEVAGIEMITDADGNAWTYDVNTNTNYNPDAEKAAGVAGTEQSGMGALATFLGRELAAHSAGTLAAE